MNSHSGEIPSRVAVRGEVRWCTSSPGPSPLGEAWYTLFVHAQNTSVQWALAYPNTLGPTPVHISEKFIYVKYHIIIVMSFHKHIHVHVYSK